MKELRGIGALTAASIALLATQPAAANPAQVSNVRLNPNRGGVDVVLETQGSDRAPQVFNVNRGNTWTAYVFNTSIAQPYQQNNPAPGISSVSVSPVAGNGVQVVVVGQGSAPTGQVASRNAQGVILSVTGNGAATAQSPTPVPQMLNTVAQPQTVAQVPPSTTPVAPMIPNPSITTTGTPNMPGVPTPSLFNRAVAPPVGDISISPLNTAPSTVDLGTNERIPRLVLRDASVREVLSLLARAAGLNLAYSETPGGAPGAQDKGNQSGGPKISLDIENESVQDVFNYVLRVTCIPVGGQGGSQGGAQLCDSLEASRSGRTIFVGPKLPNAARNVIVRSLRLNQVSVDSAIKFLVGLGAESAANPTTRTTRVSSSSQIGGQSGGQSSGGQSEAAVSDTDLKAQRIEFKDGVPPLRGLQALGDERTNSVTLVGSPKHVELAMSQLSVLDVRRRMVAVNVKVIDVNLLALRRAGTSFSFGVGNNQFISQGGVALLNFGRNTPGQALGLNDSNTFGSTFGSSPALPFSGDDVSNFAKNFSLQLQTAVTNGNAKVLTDPTLIVQEGQTATVNLVQEVVTNFNQQTTFGTGASQVTVTVEKKPVGLILPVKVDRIDDNGFVSLSVAPSISRPDRTQDVRVAGSTFSVTLLSERRLESGQIRIRDGQTLVLSGIIQESDRVSATKVPILGDIPLLGSLFRRTERENDRREVIVLLTPQIVDDSDRSNFGYGYVPGPEVRQMLQQNR